MKNRKSMGWIGIVLIACVILILVVVIVKAMSTDPDAPEPPQDTNWKVQCEVKIDDSITHPDGFIERVTCDRVAKCGFFGIVPLELFQTGHVRLRDAATTLDKDDWTAYPFIPAKVTLSGCTKYNSVKIVLTNQDDEIIDTKEVSLI